MTKTSTNLPVCIHCDTPRPADETLCPSCGKPWIDVQVAAVAPAAPSDTPVVIAAAVAATAELVPNDGDPTVEAHDTGEFGLDEWTLPPEPPKRRPLWLIPVVLVMAVMGFWAYIYYADSPTTTTTVVAEPSTSTSTTPSTTVAVQAAESTTTTAPLTTTTTVPYPPASFWEDSGQGLSTAQLAMKASGLGPIELGGSLVDVAGQLVTSLGQAESAGDSDLCQPEEMYWLQWGPLRVIFDGYEPTSNFVSFRYEETDAGEVDVPLVTLSGIGLGDTVGQLQNTYSFYTITFEVIDGQDHFRLIDGGELLLWGPVSSSDSAGTVPGTVLGIYSPSPCPTG
jgi:hypothetical protein